MNIYIYSISLFTTSTTKTNSTHLPKNLLHTKNPPYIFIFPLTNIFFIEYHHIGDDMIIYIHISSERSKQISKLSFFFHKHIYISVLFQHKNFQNKHHMFTLIIESTTCLYFYNSFYLLTYAWCC